MFFISTRGRRELSGRCWILTSFSTGVDHYMFRLDRNADVRLGPNGIFVVEWWGWIIWVLSASGGMAAGSMGHPASPFGLQASLNYLNYYAPIRCRDRDGVTTTEVIASVRELGEGAHEFIRANSGVVVHLVGWSLTTTCKEVVTLASIARYGVRG